MEFDGSLVEIFLAPEGGAKMAPRESVELVAGKGIRGDRYGEQRGSFSKKEGPRRQVSLFEEETLHALKRDHQTQFSSQDCRRNLITRGVPLNHLVGRKFHIGDTLLLGHQLAEPCSHLEGMTFPGIQKLLAHRGGLRAEILRGGVVSIRDRIKPPPPCFGEEQSKSTHDYYQQNAESFFQSTVNIDMSEFYRPFLAGLTQRGEPIRILDVGCGSGRDSLYFSRQGFRVTALEPSADLAQLASRHTGEEVLNLDLKSFDSPIKFHGVWACASLLHVAKREMGGIFHRVWELLVPGGLFYVSFKLGRGEGVVKGRFFNYYTPEILEEIIHFGNRFELTKLWVSEDRRTDRAGEEWVNLLVRSIPGQ